MNKEKVYYLKPGEKIFQTGRGKLFPGNKLKLEAGKDKFLKVDEKYYPVIGHVFDFLISQGRMVDEDGYASILKKQEDEKEAKKAEAAAGKEASTKRAELEKKAKALGIKFDSKTSQKALGKWIVEKECGIAARSEMEEVAKMLEIEFKEDISSEDLELLILEKQEENEKAEGDGAGFPPESDSSETPESEEGTEPEETPDSGDDK